MYPMPPRGLDWWAAVTDVPCPVADCTQTVVWYEAGYVPGYRVCMAVADDDAPGAATYDHGTRRHRFLAVPGMPPSGGLLIRDECCETTPP